MKKLLLTITSGAVLIAATVSSYGQGVVSFQNSASTSPAVFGNGPKTGKVTGTTGQYTYGLYIGAFGDTAISQMTLVDTVGSSSVVFAAGAISGGTVTLPSPFINGTQYADIVAGWTTADGSLAASAAAGDYSGQSALGFITPNPSPVAQIFGAGAGQIGGLSLTVTATPEPGTIALGGLGAAALLLFRRKKK